MVLVWFNLLTKPFSTQIYFEEDFLWFCKFFKIKLGFLVGYLGILLFFFGYCTNIQGPWEFSISEKWELIMIFELIYLQMWDISWHSNIYRLISSQLAPDMRHSNSSDKCDSYSFSCCIVEMVTSGCMIWDCLGSSRVIRYSNNYLNVFIRQ